MFLESTRFGIQTIKSPANVQSMIITKAPGYLRALEITNTTLTTYYALFYDQQTVSPVNVAVGATGYVAPKVVFEVPPATALNSKGKLLKNDLQLQDKTQYTNNKDYFSNAISVAFSSDPLVFKPASGIYPLSLIASISYGRTVSFDPNLEALNIGQEPHPAVIENGTTVVQSGYFDTRPGGNLEQLCQKYVADGWKNVRFNYVSPTYSKFSNWKDAALIVKNYFPNMLIGITAANGQSGGVTKTQFDTFVAGLPDWVSWCQTNGIKRVGLFNEEANHCNVSSYTSAGISDYKTYIVQQLFAASITAKNTLGANVEVSGSFSEGERNTFAAQFTAGTANSIDKFSLNAYDTVSNMANHLVEAKAQFTINNVCKLNITECSKDYGINDPIYGGTIGTANSGNEYEQASDLVQRRNVIRALSLEVFWFCGIDGGVGGVVDQFGLVTTSGKNRKAYEALVEK